MSLLAFSAKEHSETMHRAMLNSPCWWGYPASIQRCQNAFSSLKVVFRARRLTSANCQFSAVVFIITVVRYYMLSKPDFMVFKKWQDDVDRSRSSVWWILRRSKEDASNAMKTEGFQTSNYFVRLAMSFLSKKSRENSESLQSTN